MSKLVSILTLTHNDYDFIFEFVESICDNFRTTSSQVELLFYAWECDEKYLEILNKLNSLYDVDYIKIFTGSNLGFAGGNNYLSELAIGSNLVFLNPDTSIQRIDITQIDRNCENNFITAFKITLTKNLLGESRMNGRDSTHQWLSCDYWFYPQPVDINSRFIYADGAGFAISKKLFQKIGKFDNLFFVFAEDVDLSIRAFLLGYSVLPTISTEIYHFSGGTIQGGAPLIDGYRTTEFRRFMHEKNMIMIALKYLSPFFLFLWILTWLPQFFATISLFIINRNFNLLKSLFKSLIFIFRNWEEISRNRQNFKTKKTKSDLDLFTILQPYPSRLKLFYRFGMPKK
jgi:GT2 family glycosyltransferase